jgi:hypothetical protein
MELVYKIGLLQKHDIIKGYDLFDILLYKLGIYLSNFL